MLDQKTLENRFDICCENIRSRISLMKLYAGDGHEVNIQGLMSLAPNVSTVDISNRILRCDNTIRIIEELKNLLKDEDRRHKLENMCGYRKKIKILACFLYSLPTLNLLPRPLHPPVRRESRSEQRSLRKLEPTRQSERELRRVLGSNLQPGGSHWITIIMTLPLYYCTQFHCALCTHEVGCIVGHNLTGDASSCNESS